MAEFDVTAPDGKKYRITAPEGTTQQEALEHFRSQMASTTAPSENDQAPSTIPLSMWGDFLRGTGQGFLGIPESIYQFGERTIGLPRPTGAIPDWLRAYRDRAESSGAGIAGEVAGNVAAFAGGGEVADALGLASRAPAAVTEWAARNPRLATTLLGGGQATIAQPTKGDKSAWDFWRKKAEDAGLGAILGRILGRPIQRAAHEEATAANQADIAEHARDVANTQQANEIAARVARQDTASDVEATRRANQAAAARHQTDVADVRRANQADIAEHQRLSEEDAERHRAFSAAQETFHAGERTKQQAAIDALAERSRVAQATRQSQINAKAAVPQQTTGGWWQRTGDKIGEPISADARPETGATVQAKVGARLNSITDRMTLDPADTSFTEQLAEIRRTASGSLQGHNQAGFYTQPQASPLERIIRSPAEGEPLLPRTGVAAPPPPSGMWADQVLDPLKKGPLSGRQLTEYITRLGNEANTLATRARAAAPGSPEAADLLTQASALRQVQDTVIGHAAGSADDKLALEKARQAYLMWGVGNDAAKASRGGVATPAQLIQMFTKRLGEARYKQALVDPSSPYHEDVNWLQQQFAAHTAPVPSAAEVRAAQPTPPRPLPLRPTPIPAPGARTPPVPRAMPTAPAKRLPPPPRVATVLPTPAPPTPRTVPKAPNYSTRSLPRAAEHAVLAGVVHDPIWRGYQIARAVQNLIGRRSGGSESGLERWARRVLTDRPRVQRAARSGAATAGGQAQREPSVSNVSAVPQAAIDALNWAWGSRR